MSAWSAAAASRLLLSLAIEPGDSRLGAVLQEAGGPDRLIERLRSDATVGPPAWASCLRRAETEYDDVRAAAETRGLRWVVPGDPEWPEALDDLDHVEPASGSAGTPLGLWCRGAGDLGTLSKRAVAVVGARDCTTYGAEAAADIAAAAAVSGYTVVSGAAFGIDASAHRGGVLAGDPGIAVLACGADLDYPRAHAALLRRIAEHGVVVSEYPPGRPAARQRFLARNRLIAALSDGLVVVEAARRSGSLNTLHWADRLGRATMAVPGPITAAQSQGTHEAIRGGKAVLVGSGMDVVAELVGFTGRVASSGGGPDVMGDAVLAALSDAEASTADLARSLRVGVSHVVRALERLAADGLARRGEYGWARVGQGELTQSSLPSA